MRIGFHTGAFNSAYVNFEACLAWARKNDLHSIECGVIDGVSWLAGLGYQPHVALYENPVLLKQKMAVYGVQFSPLRTSRSPSPGCDRPWPSWGSRRRSNQQKQ